MIKHMKHKSKSESVFTNLGRRRYVATGATASAADGVGGDRVGAVALWCVGVSWRQWQMASGPSRALGRRRRDLASGAVAAADGVGGGDRGGGVEAAWTGDRGGVEAASTWALTPMDMHVYAGPIH